MIYNRIKYLFGNMQMKITNGQRNEHGHQGCDQKDRRQHPFSAAHVVTDLIEGLSLKLPPQLTQFRKLIKTRDIERLCFFQLPFILKSKALENIGGDVLLGTRKKQFPAACEDSRDEEKQTLCCTPCQVCRGWTPGSQDPVSPSCCAPVSVVTHHSQQHPAGSHLKSVIDTKH